MSDTSSCRKFLLIWLSMMEDAEGDETRLSTDTDGRSNRDDAELSYWRSQYPPS